MDVCGCGKLSGRIAIQWLRQANLSLGVQLDSTWVSLEPNGYGPRTGVETKMGSCLQDGHADMSSMIASVSVVCPLLYYFVLLFARVCVARLWSECGPSVGMCVSVYVSICVYE